MNDIDGRITPVDHMLAFECGADPPKLPPYQAPWSSPRGSCVRARRRKRTFCRYHFMFIVLSPAVDRLGTTRLAAEARPL